VGGCGNESAPTDRELDRIGLALTDVPGSGVQISPAIGVGVEEDPRPQRPDQTQLGLLERPGAISVDRQGEDPDENAIKLANSCIQPRRGLVPDDLTAVPRADLRRVDDLVLGLKDSGGRKRAGGGADTRKIFSLLSLVRVTLPVY